jgi:hypothetical protein
MWWVVNATPRPLYLRERPGALCVGGWVSPRAGLDGCGKSRPPPGFDPRTVQPLASRYTVYAIPALIYFYIVYIFICIFIYNKFYIYIYSQLTFQTRDSLTQIHGQLLIGLNSHNNEICSFLFSTIKLLQEKNRKRLGCLV